MTKAEAIKKLQTLIETRVGRDEINDACYEVIDYLEDAPVLEWIDCDERLPEQDELVITLIYGHDVIVQNEGETFEQALERISHYARTSVGFYGSDGWYGAEGYPEICTPKYWMPIPKPPEERP